MKHYIEFVFLHESHDVLTGKGMAFRSAFEAGVRFYDIKRQFSVEQNEAQFMLDLYQDEALTDTVFVTHKAFTELTGYEPLTYEEYAAMDVNQ